MSDVKSLRDIADRVESSGEMIPDDRLAERMVEHARALRAIAGELETIIETGEVQPKVG